MTTGVGLHRDEEVHLRLLTANEQRLDTKVDLHHVVRIALNTLVRLLGLLGFEVALEDLDCFLHATQGGNADIFFRSAVV